MDGNAMPKSNENGFAAARGSSFRAGSLEKGLEILEALAQSDSPLSAAKLAERLSRPVKDILKTTDVLLERGYLRPQEDGFQVSSKMLNLAQSAFPLRTLIDTAQSHMCRLVGQIAHGCHLSVVSDYELVTISTFDAQEDFSFNLKPGFRCPLASSAAGAVIFGLETLDTRARLSSHIKRELGGKAWHDFYDAAEAARVAGHCIQPSDIMPAISDIAAPVFDDKGVIGALTVPFFKPRNSITIDDVRRLLEDTCHHLSLELGRPGDPLPQRLQQPSPNAGRPTLTLVRSNA
jgi:DNA-binding IclR family transcriptional regulator